MNIAPNALTVLERRYLQKDENGQNIETVEGMFRRVADAIAAADLHFDKTADAAALSNQFYDAMTELDFLPNSPTLMNAGRELGQLSACFVLPVADSLADIFEAIKQAALIHQSGGGTGFSFSRLRPAGAAVRSTGGVASGPISFMKVFNMATEAVKQGGTRRGANMGILRVDHPDILDFISCKEDNADINNFNISVGITEAFMEAVEKGESYDLVDPHDGRIAAQLDARQVFDKIVNSAWHNGEPGIVFLDRLNRDNVVPSQGEIESTNPCGEQPLLPYESCNLGSLNLVHMLRTDENGRVMLDWEKLRYTVQLAIHFLDNVIEVNKYPIQQIEETTKLTRKVGLGVMGYADMLLEMDVPYNSEEAVLLAGEVMEFINRTAHEASQELAQVRGTFPLFDESIFKDQTPLRNGTSTTIAPTGTISIIAGCSSGVEPVFAYVFIRNIMDGTELIEVNPVLRSRLEREGLYNENLMRRIAAEGTLAHIDELPEHIRRVFVCSHDITPEFHLRTQAAFQRHVDNAVSKTVNFPNSATREEVREAFVLAYKLDCKGVTIYRDGSRSGQVLNIGKVKKEGETEEKQEKQVFRTNILPRPRPAVTMGVTERMKIGCGNLYVTVNYDENGICEVFTSTGKAGGCPSQSEATARLVSIALRAGVSLDELLNQLRGIRCPSTIRQKGVNCTSCPDAIARVIKKVDTMIKRGGSAEPAHFRYCPECGAKLEQEGGCTLCRSCGFSQCEMDRPPVWKAVGEEDQPARDPGLAGVKYCPECGSLLEHEGGCVVCRACGYSKCN